MNGKTTLEHVTCARLPAARLAALASLRRIEGISVVLEGDSAWVFWENEDDRVLRVVLPVEGVELFERREGGWYRPGCRLPRFESVPVGEPIPLSQAVFPAGFSVDAPGDRMPGPVPLRLARDGRPRPTTAALGPLAELGRWAETAPSSEIEAVRGAIRGDLAWLLGRSLPPWPGSTRYWGRRVLVPIGFEPRPNLPESTLLEAFGALDREILRLVPEGERLAVEVVPLSAFGTMSRAGIRLALGAGSS